MLSAEPRGAGEGGFETAVAEAKVVSSVMGSVEYLMSYAATSWVSPSSPGAVQSSLTVSDESTVAVRSVMAEGGVVSSAMVVAVAGLESCDQFGTSSAVFIAKW